MIDTHAHLSDQKFEGDLSAVIERARSAGVVALISPATSLDDAKEVVKLSEQYADVYGLVGLYPGEADKSSWQTELAEIKRMLLTHERVVGVGEIGLDEVSYRQNPDFEEAVFRAQLEMADELDCPVAVHCRGTQKEMRDILDSYARLPSGMMHCFGGSEEWLEYVLSRGFYIGFDGNVTYKNAEDLRSLAKKVPLERLVLETDSPYLPPIPHRGERNEPGNVRITAEFLALTRGESINQLIAATTLNAKSLFGI